jgi:GNAT superfamily N-acetyltransferase
MPSVVPITAEELNRIHELDVTEEIDHVYRQHGSRLELVAQSHSRSARSEDDWAPEVRHWQAFVRDKGAAWAAFENGRMIASAVLRNSLEPDMSQLAGLYVDRAWRRTGIGSKLVEAVATEAREAGAKRLYVSAIPSEATVDFYLRLGFQPTESPNHGLFELEPEDVHMCLNLENPRPKPRHG